jgi:integrase
LLQCRRKVSGMSVWIETRSGKYLVRWREPGGQKHSKAVPTKAAARGLKSELENQLFGGTYVPKALRDRLFGDYVLELLTSELQLEASTMYNHQKAFGKWIEPGLGNTPIGEIDASAIRRFFSWMKSQGASDKTVGRVRAQLTKYFRRAMQEGILTRNPVAAVPAPNSARHEIRILTPEEVQAVADAHPPQLRMIPLLCAWGTFRIGEVAALTEDCIEGDRITVKRAVGTAGSVRYLKSPKTASSRRTVQLPGWVMAELREHILEHRHEDGFLFRDTRGQLVSHQGYHTSWRKALRAAGFDAPWPRPHDLRHTAVALMIRAGAHPKQIQARCGHATIKETMDTYGHLFPGHDDELVRTLESFRPQVSTVVEL